MEFGLAFDLQSLQYLIVSGFENDPDFDTLNQQHKWNITWPSFTLTVGALRGGANLALCTKVD
eukprot:7435798-Pyramimonas_sp.AAC.1